MKTLYTLLLSAIVLASCSNTDDKKITTDLVNNPLTAEKNADQVDMPKIELSQDFFDFGEMNQKESVSTEFVIKNTGDAPLLIRSAKGSCGCTVPEWPKEPVAVGEEAVIKVTFNSGNKKGKQNKTVTLVTNAIPSTKVLTIKGTVLVPETK
ncbi:MAG: DUF1573 domain-containing protein [Flavobacteriales bacterium]|jgi:hypothetical protein|nr:DUF1573 domain-containing protein [Flavobacteriales bacterium]